MTNRRNKRNRRKRRERGKEERVGRGPEEGELLKTKARKIVSLLRIKGFRMLR
jgi:hypothetical protein